jgi:hypothetical protein
MLFLVGAVLLLAGFVNGVIGLGLPTVSMGLLAATMQPNRALAIVILPAIITNILAALTCATSLGACGR